MSGVITDGVGVYANNMACYWIVQPSMASSSITFVFTAFNTERTYDQVRIYSGSSGSGSAAYTLSGTTNPGTLTISNNAAYVSFTTDSSVTSTGFSLYYYATPDGARACVHGG